MESNNEGDSAIAKFFESRSVFITGATGFMGKVLVEKLLRSCPGIKNVYLLLRSKKGLDARQRLDGLFSAELFKRLNEAQGPKARNKVIAIQGDISFDNLGISDDDRQTLIREVSVVFHSAATVKFDEPLRTSVEFNVLGTRRVIQLCHEMKELKALIHVSTAYANCNRTEIDEVLYDPKVRPNQIIDAVKWMDEDLINQLTPKIIGDRPNTYTFTKALAETLLSEECKALPVAIVRPSIVTAAWREPLRGWVDNINGPTGLVLAVGKGIMRTMLYDGNAIADLIPVDAVINVMITAAWSVSTKPTNQLMIYNVTSGQENPITWGDIERIAFPVLLRYPSVEVFRYPGGSFKHSRLVNDISCLLQHVIPAYLVDAFLGLTGRKRMMVRAVEKLHKAITSLEDFTTCQWQFKCNNVLALSKELQGSDKETFAFDIRQLHWPTYWEDYVLGMRKFILKEDHSSLPIARKKLNRLYYRDSVVFFGVLLAVCHLFARRSQLASRMWFFLATLAVRIYSALNKAR